MDRENGFQETGNKSIETLLQKATLLVSASEMSDELKGLSDKLKGTLTFYDSENVKWNVDGYDFVFFDTDGNLKRFKINPLELGFMGTTHERENLEQRFHSAGYILDDSEKLRSAIYRQLNRK